MAERKKQIAKEVSVELAEEELEEELEKELTEEELKERRRRNEELSAWVPKTKLGKEVKAGKVKDIDKILKEHKILEPEIIDSLLDLKADLLSIGQAKGKFGGGKRRAWRQTQKKTAEGNVPGFSCMVIVGNGRGYVGVGLGRAKETLPARSKALRKAKLNVFKVKRGCASFDCVCGEEHSVPYKTEGKCSSCKIIFWPAPQGTGLVAGDEVKKILKLAGIKDVYSKTFGKKRTTINLAKAAIDALKKTSLKENRR